MTGTTISKGTVDWQIIGREGGHGTLGFSGTFQVPQAAVDAGAERANPVIRVMREEDNAQVIPWTYAACEKSADGLRGDWQASLEVPAGGLYRVETGLDTISGKPGLKWIFRGDVRLHLGVGDLFAVAGQSNAAGYGKDWAPDPPDLMVHLLRNRGTWDLASHPINESTGAMDSPNTEAGIPGTSPCIAFGRRLSRGTGFPVGLVTTALGGSPISRWDPDAGDLYANMMRRIRACGSRLSGVLWYQGCSDATPLLAPGYKERFSRLAARLRADLGYEVPVFTCQLNRFLSDTCHEAWGTLREAQRAAAREIPAVYVMPTTDLPVSDDIHNSSLGNLLLGERLARQAGQALYGWEPFQAPDIARAFHTPEGQVAADFDHVRQGFQIFQNAAAGYGFTLEDGRGRLSILSATTDPDRKNRLLLTPERALQGRAFLSHAWEAAPVANPVADALTGLPLLSFYRMPVENG